MTCMCQQLVGGPDAFPGPSMGVCSLQPPEKGVPLEQGSWRVPGYKVLQSAVHPHKVTTSQTLKAWRSRVCGSLVLFSLQLTERDAGQLAVDGWPSRPRVSADRRSGSTNYGSKLELNGCVDIFRASYLSTGVVKYAQARKRYEQLTAFAG
ncbi:hypothetical protein VTI74DRAFT_6799 [Chaetomium olivicolor]